MSDQIQLPFRIEQKAIGEYETLKESPAEVKLLVEIYERRIAELNAVIFMLVESRTPLSPPTFRGESSLVPTSKPKIATTSQLVAEMEKRSRLGEKK